MRRVILSLQFFCPGSVWRAALRRPAVVHPSAGFYNSLHARPSCEPSSKALPVMPRSLPLVVLFTSALFVSAFLLFLVQPLQARMVLPRFGGSPAVWNTCMVFFQAVLRLRYGYAHLFPTWLGTRPHALLHVAVLATPALVLPVALPAGWDATPSTLPVLSLLVLLAVTVGLPF